MSKVKVAIRYQGSSPDEFEIETVWADPVPDGYRIDNIPFYAPSIAYRDIVAATRGANGQLEYQRLVRASGHSTVRVAIENLDDVEVVRRELRTLGCASELSELPRLIAVDVPPLVPYPRVRAFLDAGRKVERFDFEEACLGQTGHGNAAPFDS